MKREEFEIRKQAYKEDLRHNLKKPLEKIDNFYEDKQYVGTPQMREAAKQTDSKNKEDEIRQKIKDVGHKTANFHFDGKTKREATKIVMQEGKAKSNFNQSSSIVPLSPEYQRNLKKMQLNESIKNFP